MTVTSLFCLSPSYLGKALVKSDDYNSIFKYTSVTCWLNKEKADVSRNIVSIDVYQCHNRRTLCLQHRVSVSRGDKKAAVKGTETAEVAWNDQFQAGSGAVFIGTISPAVRQ